MHKNSTYNYIFDIENERERERENKYREFIIEISI